MTRMMTAAVAAFALTASVTAARAASDGQPGFFQQVNSTGWASRLNRDRFPYAYGFPDEGIAPYGAPDFGYDEEAAPIYRRAYRPIAPDGGYGYGAYDD